MEQSSIRELCWGDIREELQSLNPELSKIIDELNPGKQHTLFRAKYFFGDEIIRKGLLYVPHNGVLTAINGDNVDTNIKNKLSYNLGTNPVSMILRNSVEIFILLGNRAISLYGLVTPGKIFSTSRILSGHQPFSPPFLWNMTAGARSIFMLPRISDYLGHERVAREFKLEIAPPKGLLDHWSLFKGIVRSEALDCPWSTEMLFFSKKWFDSLYDPAWKDFRLYLLQSAWDSSEFWRNQFVWDLVFSIVQENRNLKPNPYVADTAKHILAMGVGAAPGFASAIDESAGPCELIEDVYTKIYQIKEYQPIIMHPYTFESSRERPVYYSLEYPSTMEFSPKSKRTSNKITDLREIKYIMDKYFSEIARGYLNIKDTPFQNLFDKVKFDYFHSNVAVYDDITESSQMPLGDKHLKPLLPVTQYENKKFPNNSPFVRGCVRVMSK